MSIPDADPGMVAPGSGEGDRSTTGGIPLPPPELIALVGGGDDFVAVGRAIADLLIEHGGMRSGDRVLEIGCGVGRVARVLADHLRPSGSYDGMDVHRPHIDWCRAHITPVHAHVRFHHADIRNAAYNPKGGLDAASYRFPFPDGSFDFVFLSSVFTHMQESEVAAYLREIRRLLAPRGRLLATFFLLNPESERGVDEGRSRLAFGFRDDALWAHSLEMPEIATAFPEARVHRLFDSAHLSIRRVDYGDWCGRRHALTYQDVVIAVPA